MATQNIAYGTRVAMTVTNLQSLANDSTDPFSGWQSDRVDNRSTLAMDYEIRIHLPTANTSPASTVSPTATRYSTTTASVRPSPRSGSRKT